LAKVELERVSEFWGTFQWDISRERTEPLDHDELQGPVRHLYLYVASDLYERVKKVTTVAGVNIAPWLRSVVRQITTTDFPVSWQEAKSAERSHDSRTYGNRFMLRLNNALSRKLQEMGDRFDVPKATIIRHLIAQAKPEDFPPSWHMRSAERHVQQRPR
jgi:hypothetical protein